MSATIKQIAKICGVSREVVYQILRDAPKASISAEKIIAVKSVARNMGYAGNQLGAIPAVVESYRVGVVINSEGNPFFDDVIRGLELGAEELKDFGVNITIRTMRGYKAQKQVQLMEMAAEESDIVILTPINHELVKRKIEELFHRGIYVITMNTDIEDSKRLCYVGSDYRQGGRIAANLAGLLYPGETQIGIIAGAKDILGHRQRAEGFAEMVRESYPQIQIVHLAYDEDDELTAKRETERLIERYPGVTCLFAVAAGIYGVCQGIEAAGREGDIHVIGFDRVPTTIEYMRRGIVRAVLFQQPVVQGYKALKTAYYFLVSGVPPENDHMLINTSIKIMSNVLDEEENDFL